MVVRGISLYILLGHLFIARVGSDCLPVECLKCDAGETVEGCKPCEVCQDRETPPKCIKDCPVSIDGPDSLDEGDTIILKCVQNCTNLNLTFEWTKDGNLMEHQNESNLTLTEVLSQNAGNYACRVNNSCGTYPSSPHNVTVNNGSVVILVVCGLSAVALVVIMGLAMKLKMRRDNAKHKERRNRRAQVGQSGGPAPITPRES